MSLVENRCVFELAKLNFSLIDDPYLDARNYLLLRVLIGGLRKAASNTAP
jgi:hypothetical protein